MTVRTLTVKPLILLQCVYTLCSKVKLLQSHTAIKFQTHSENNVKFDRGWDEIYYDDETQNVPVYMMKHAQKKNTLFFFVVYI